jgi:hypothetical protein
MTDVSSLRTIASAQVHAHSRNVEDIAHGLGTDMSGISLRNGDRSCRAHQGDAELCLPALGELGHLPVASSPGSGRRVERI